MSHKEVRYQCLKCDKLCDVVSIDEGGYENFWGASVWHQAWSDVSECCQDEVDEVDEKTAMALELL